MNSNFFIRTDNHGKNNKDNNKEDSDNEDNGTKTKQQQQ